MLEHGVDVSVWAGLSKEKKKVENLEKDRSYFMSMTTLLLVCKSSGKKEPKWEWVQLDCRV